MRLKGQSRVKEFLHRLLTNNRVPSGLLFYGPEGVGKTVASLDLAQAVLCKDRDPWGCGECTSCRYIHSAIEDILEGKWEELSVYEEINGKKVFCYLQGEHPDFIFLPPQGSTIGINQVRALKNFVYVKPALSGRKVAVIDNAHLMTREASNSLLKVLEEPPLDTHLVLVSQGREQLLPTIVSRTFQVEFPPLEEYTFYQLLGDTDRELFHLSRGSYTKALDLRTKGAVKKLASKFVRGSVEEVLHVVQEVDKLEEEDKLLFLDLLEEELGRLLSEKGLNYDKFEMLVGRLSELRSGLGRSLRLSLGLLSLHAMWR